MLPKHNMQCSVCGKNADVVNGVAVRSCEHGDAAIIASLQATATGDGACK